MHVLDLTGLNCPLPILKTKKFLAEVESMVRIRVITSDPASLIDLQDFCNKTGHRLIEQSTKNGIINSIIEHR